jgi:ABC-2 type transport system permease protein
MNAIYILWLRQLKRQWRAKSRIIGSIGQPILFLLALGFGFGPIFAAAGGGSYIDFIAPGIIAMGILFNAVFSGMEIIWDKQFGFLKETLVAPVSRTKIMIGRTLGGATVAVIQGIVVFIITLFVGFRATSIGGFFLSLVFMILIALLFTSIGTAIASVLEDMQGFGLIVNFFIMPIFFLSGALFPLTGLPTVVAFLAKIDPLTFGVDAIRGTLVGGNYFSLGTDALVLTIITATFVAVGSYLFSRIEV